jgi:leucyl/phenylalanyl-tRNA---protein transferase
LAQAITPWVITQAYSQGIFPMTMEDGEVGWFRPHIRALFPITGARVSRSFARLLKQVEVFTDSTPIDSSSRFQVTFDTAFEEVMRGCLRPDDNWISEDFIQIYTEIHRQGWGHSCEVWQDHRLVGGLYGIALGSCFCAESMFHRETDCSKIALWAMINRCRALGFDIFDAQVMNPHLDSMGAFEIEHEEYMQLLEVALQKRTPWSR